MHKFQTPPTTEPKSVVQQTPAQTQATPCKHGVECLNLNPVHLQKRTHPSRPNCAKGYGCFDYSPEHRIRFIHPREFYPAAVAPIPQLASAYKLPSQERKRPSYNQFEEMERDFSRGGWWNGHEFVNDGGDAEEYDEEEEFDEAAYLRYLEEEAKDLEKVIFHFTLPDIQRKNASTLNDTETTECINTYSIKYSFNQARLFTCKINGHSADTSEIGWKSHQRHHPGRTQRGKTGE
jgi:hypothetical protein